MKKAAILVLIAASCATLLWLTFPDQQNELPAPAPISPRIAAPEEPPPSDGAAQRGNSVSPEAPNDAARREIADRQTISGIVLDPRGRPIAGANCSLRPTAAAPGLESLLAFQETEPDPGAEPAAEPIREATSDPEGRFELDAGPSGPWTLRVQAEGFAAWREAGLTPGAFRWVRLQRTRELLVRVRNESGQPVADAEVSLLSDEYAPPWQAASRARSDLSGKARLRAAPGPWILAVRHPDYRFHSSAWNGANRGEYSEREITLARGIRIRGRVSLGAAGAPPPAGTKISIESVRGLQEHMEIACDAEGSFETGHRFAPGQTLELAARAPGFAESRAEADLRAASPGDEVAVSLVLERAERFARGRAIDAQGRPVQDATVFVLPLLHLPAEETLVALPSDLSPENLPDTENLPKESLAARWRSCGKTDARGNFRISGLSPQRAYSALLVAPGFANARRWIPEGPPGSTHDLGTIALPPGARFWGALRTRAGALVPRMKMHTVWVRETILVPGASVRTSLPGQMTGAFDAVTDEEGGFLLADLPAGKFFVLVGREMLGPFEVAPGENQGPIALEIPFDPRFESAGFVAISGRVAGADGAARGKAWVQAFRKREGAGPGDLLEQELLSGRAADAQGRFTLSVPRPGPYSLRAVDLEGGFAETTLVLRESDASQPLEIQLPALATGAPASLSGLVRGPDGSPAPGMKLTLQIAPSLVSCSCLEWEAATDAQGRFDFGPVAAGMHRLLVADPQGRWKARSLYPARAGEEVELEMGF